MISKTSLEFCKILYSYAGLVAAKNYGERKMIFRLAGIYQKKKIVSRG
jgi:hypothetical protein